MTSVTLSLHFDRYTGASTVNSLDGLDAGPGKDIDITKITGLEAPPRQVSTSDLAAAPGAAMTGEHIKARPIHVEAKFRSSANTVLDIDRLTAFNYPGKYRLCTTLKWTDTAAERVRYIDGYIEGWALKDRKNMDAAVAFTLDMICPDPFFRDTPDPVEPAAAHVATLSARKARARSAAVMGGNTPGPFRAVITASGDVVRPRVTDNETGQWLEVAATLHAGSVLHVSTDQAERTVRIDGDYDGRPYMSRGSTAFLVAPGGSVSVTAEEGVENMTSAVAYQARYDSF